MLAPSLICPGHVFGKYTLVKPLGEGGYGGVWLAERITNHQQHQLNRRVALKLRHRHESQTDMHDANLSFLRDWYVGNLIQHPNIVAIQDIVTDGPDIAIVMEWVDGFTFGEIIRRLSSLDVFLPLAAVLEAGVGVCAGLHALHSVRRPDGTPYNIVHRDIKPPNLMIDLHGVVRVLDLGIAKSDELPGDHTATGIAKGTKEYMAPEQYLSHNLSPATDLFAVGAVLFELATKERLFRSDAEDEYLLKRKRSGHAASRISAYEDRLGPLAPVLRRCLAIELEDRPQRAEELGQALQAILDGAPRGPGLRELMSALRGDIPPRMAQRPEWAPLALALDRPRRPTPVIHVPRNLAMLLPELDAPQTIAEELELLEDDEDVAQSANVAMPLQAPLDPEGGASPAELKRPARPDEPTRSLPVVLTPNPVATLDPSTLIRPQRTPPPTPTPPTPTPPTPTPPTPTPPTPTPTPTPAARGVTPAPPPNPPPAPRPALRAAPSPPPLVGAALLLPKTPTSAPGIMSASGVSGANDPPDDEDAPWRSRAFLVAAAMMAGVIMAVGLLVTAQLWQAGAAAPAPALESEGPSAVAPPGPGDGGVKPSPSPPTPAACDGVSDKDGDGHLPCLPSTDEERARITAQGLLVGDCDDDDPKVHPGAEGDGRGVDNNCDEQLTGAEAAPTARTTPTPTTTPTTPPTLEQCFKDMDGDGYGNLLRPLQGEECRGKNVSTNSDDCVDTDPRKHPGAPEPPGLVDFNCDGHTTLPPKPPSVAKVDPSIQGTLNKKLTVKVNLDPAAGRCSALSVVTSPSSSFSSTKSLRMSGGPTEWRVTASVDEKSLYFRLKCIDAATAEERLVGDPSYQVSQ